MSVIPDTIQPYMPLIQGIALAIAIFLAGWVLSKWANGLTVRALRKAKVDKALSNFLGSLAQYSVLAAAVISSLGAVGVETTSLVAVFASAGIAVGLALQGNLANFASGVMILFFRPFNLDDLVTLAGHTGTVMDIGLFATTMVNLDNETIILPNSAITSASIVNLSSRGIRRGTIDIGVAYGSDLKQVQDVLLQAAKRSSLVLEDPGAATAFVGFGASSLDFKLFIWCNSPEYLNMLHEVRLAVYEELNTAGIEIPFNQVVVHQAS